MDDNKLKKRQSLKVIISEAVMVLAVVVMVVVLAFIVSGYWLNSDFKVERQGMLQVSSIPTGANLDIDGESSWLQRTNTSKVLSSGEHTITLTKDGYDSWTKTVNITEGLLYRIHYPRLFLQNREAKPVFNTTGTLAAMISPDGSKLVIINDTTEWKIINLTNETLDPKPLNITNYFSGTSIADGAPVGLFTGKILDAAWDQDGNHILFKIGTGDGISWTLIDVNDVKNSVNLSKEFGANFSDIDILNNSASSLLAVQNGNLHKIDVPSKNISAVLVSNITDFDHYDNEVVYSAATAADEYVIGYLKLGDDKVTELEFTTEPVKVAISKFYDEQYIAVLHGSIMSLYKKADFVPVADFELGFTPDQIKVGHNGEFIVMYSGNNLATLDMETTTIYKWQVEGDSFGWLDNDMIYTVKDGELIIYDFDGLNRRVLAKNVSNRFPVTITGDRWLYYFSDGQLIREKIN